MTKITNKPIWKASKEERQLRSKVFLWGMGGALGFAMLVAAVQEMRTPGSWAKAQSKAQAEHERKFPRDGLTQEQYLTIAADCSANRDALRCR